MPTMLERLVEEEELRTKHLLRTRPRCTVCGKQDATHAERSIGMVCDECCRYKASNA